MTHNKLIDSLKVLLFNTFRSLGYEVRRPKEMEQVMGLVHLPIRTVIDVGANVGQFAQFARKKFKNAKIYCFEPIPEAYAKLKEWTEKDGHSLAYPLALGEENKRVEFFVHSDHSPSSSLLRTTPLKHHYYPFTKKSK
ncbi:MAG: FkbM family methyltransferase [Sandaracinaceae bacterium]|nr:FkbM family methyltransferase [Sandaracinaceae bacterium]